MNDYDIASLKASKVVTETFSTSFSSAIKLISKDIRQHIYNIYGLVRVADEVVDTYQGKDADIMLESLRQETYQAIKRGFSHNIIVHSFAMTAREFKIGKDLIDPFFYSMKMDLSKKTFSQKEYKKYIYGSAEVVGLMCLRVYVNGDQKEYDKLAKGAAALGSAFQKVNFLRDIKADYDVRGRYYFPGSSLEEFNDRQKDRLIKDIEKDFKQANSAINKLPHNSRDATRLAYNYYQQLLNEIKKRPAQQILQARISVSKSKKLKLVLTLKLGKR